MASGVDARLQKATKFPLEFNQKVDMQKVNLQVMKKWIAGKISDILGREDDVVVELCFNLIEGPRYPDIKALQIQLTGFLDKDTASFCKELWKLMLSAQASPQGVPKELLEAKKKELIQEKIEAEKAAEEVRRRREDMERRDREIAELKDRDRRDRGSRMSGGDIWRGGRRGDRGGDRDEPSRATNRSRSPGTRQDRDRGRGRGGYGGDRGAQRDIYVPRARGGDDRAWGHGRDRRRAARQPSVSSARSRSRSITRDSERSRAGQRRPSLVRYSRKRSLSRSRSRMRSPLQGRNARRNRGRSPTRSVSSRRRSPPPKRRRRSLSRSRSRTPPRRRHHTRSEASSRSTSPHSRSRSRSRSRDLIAAHGDGSHQGRRSPSRSVSASDTASDEGRRDRRRRRRRSSRRSSMSSDLSQKRRTVRQNGSYNTARRKTTSASPLSKTPAMGSLLDVSQESRDRQNSPLNVADKPTEADETKMHYTTAAPPAGNLEQGTRQQSAASRVPRQVLQRKANELRKKLLRERIIKMRYSTGGPGIAG